MITCKINPRFLNPFYFYILIISLSLSFDIRYCDEVDSVHHFRVILIEKVLIKILWRDYLSYIISNTQERALSGLSVDSSKDCKLPLSNTKYPTSYLRELGNCIIEILSGIFLLKHDLLSVFSLEFQENCMLLFQHTEMTELERITESVERVFQFIFLMGQHAIQKSENWPLVYLVGPTLIKCFPEITSLVSGLVQMLPPSLLG